MNKSGNDNFIICCHECDKCDTENCMFWSGDPINRTVAPQGNESSYCCSEFIRKNEDGKLKLEPYLKLGIKGSSSSIILKVEESTDYIKNEIEGGTIPGDLIISIIELTKEEYEGLKDFDGF